MKSSKKKKHRSRSSDSERYGKNKHDNDEHHKKKKNKHNKSESHRHKSNKKSKYSCTSSSESEKECKLDKNLKNFNEFDIPTRNKNFDDNQQHKKEKYYDKQDYHSSNEDTFLQKIKKENFGEMTSKNDVSSHTRKHDKRKSSESSDNENESDFTFLRYKRELNKVFFSIPKLVQNYDEFWKFLEKYELIEKRKKKENRASTSKISSSATEIKDKLNKLSIKIDRPFEELFIRVQRSKHLTDLKLMKFQLIINAYVDFKNKEKLQKLEKLKEDQANLPVAAYRSEIIEAVRNERVVIIAGDTGCGKSTQVPQYLYSEGFGRIACTQPRRIACIALAKRVAYETATEDKNEVGYQIRFEKQRNQDTKITFITEGLLLRQVAGEGELSRYDVIVLDEIHERHLHGDFLLGIMKCLINQKTDMKLVLMSATINIELFSNYFAKENVTVIQVPGRLYPIELIYRPVLIDKPSKTERFDPSPYIQIMNIIDKKYTSKERGDLLIFLSGMSEITAVVDAAKEYSLKSSNWIVLPLHSTLSLADQDKVFGYAPEGVRKCIVSTNIAETSVTIDGIRFVVDSGKVKEMSYDPNCKMQRLKEFWISKASAEQRKGRAGRTGPGVCYRLYSAEDYTELEKFSTPELQRVPLDSSLLQMISMGLPDPRKFPFIEPPPSESIENAIVSLKEHGALSANEKLTNVGKTLSKLPVDITIGKMLIMGSLFHQIDPVLSLAAALSVQTPFTNRAYRDLDCENLRKNLESDHGDPILLLNAYREWLEIKHKNSGEMRTSSNVSKKWCKNRGLEEQRFYEMTKLRTQFKDLLGDCKLLHSDKNDSELSSSERTLRHGELKLLRALKRNYKQNDSNKRKQLRVDEDSLMKIDDDDKEDEEIDIKDVEFRMKNDFSKISNLVSASSACSYKDLTMLKLILFSGLYPQYACADEFNYCKSVSEQLFHTKVKPFVALHPMSFFGNNPQILQIEEQDVVAIPGFRSKTPVSPKHQILTYLSLLETTKPYLVNTLRMPAAQTLFIFAHEIDTNSTFSNIVCDSWLSLEFPTPDSGAFLLHQASKLREKWDHLLNLQLQENSSLEDKQENIESLEFELSQGLVDFMHTSVPYTIRRLAVADLKSIYVGPDENNVEIQPNPFKSDYKCELNTEKGGVRLTKQITFNCLIDNEWSEKLSCSMLETEWICKICNFQGFLSSIEKLQHMSICLKNSPDTGKEKIISKSKKKNEIAYECPECKKTLYLLPTEVLRHKKSHLS